MIHVKRTTALIIGILSLCICSTVTWIIQAAGAARNLDRITYDTIQTIQTALPTISPSQTPEPTPTEYKLCYGGRYDTAAVAYVVDGDTIDVLIDGVTERVRYIGIDAPERGDPGYSRSTKYNADLVSGEIVHLYADTSDRDKYNRLLRYVVLENGTLINFKLVWDGYAAPAEYPPDTMCARVFAQAQYFGTPMPPQADLQVQGEPVYPPAPTGERLDSREPGER